MSKVRHLKSYHYVDEGSGNVIILLHGLFGGLANFEHTIASLKSSYRVIMPILPLYDLTIAESTVEGMLAYLKGLVEELELDDFTLLGNSLGGHIALAYCLQHPEKVNALVLTGSSGLFERAFGETLPKRSDYEYIRTKTEQTFFDSSLATKDLVDEVFEIVNDREKALRVVSIAKSAVRQNLREELQQISVPVLLIWGKNDGITPPEVAEEFHKLIPHSELKWIDRCGHAAMMEHPDIFNELLEAFLRSLKQIA
jgi:pimeloyl-ACP methyl ester carboxylesterase